ncbi:hypothetical protein BDQ94DRAFT_146021 [Aspergillus welwitschiae]|uniref:Uncharacterized protein n=1 Tax=Aspergillus welwitschiae TaxID=1341132 RepID=A0A3F3PYF2_9EURO|nr:hypothetical protein BDQ94DRAFT_146021 [Aspergillus welwitschiae]RDH31915.1 hypothetical protein BDQ94DRAFT_146021 [Aspergillus welwitschiae]
MDGVLCMSWWSLGPRLFWDSICKYLNPGPRQKTESLHRPCKRWYARVAIAQRHEDYQRQLILYGCQCHRRLEWRLKSYLPRTT